MLLMPKGLLSTVWSMDQQHHLELIGNAPSQVPPKFLTQNLHFNKVPGGEAEQHKLGSQRGLTSLRGMEEL